MISDIMFQAKCQMHVSPAMGPLHREENKHVRIWGFKNVFIFKKEMMKFGLMYLYYC